MSELPIPRLIAVRVAEDADLSTLARRLKEEVPTASLDDHGEWLQRLSSMAEVMSGVGLVILGLVFAATALCVVFATRGAMAGNRIVIEVLHFVGAEDSLHRARIPAPLPAARPEGRLDRRRAARLRCSCW